MSDRDQLIEYLLGFAKIMLKDFGAFHPFGAKITFAGDLVAVGADSGEELPPAHDLIDLLVGSFRSEAGLGKVRAIGLGLDTRVAPPGTNEKTDAVCLRLENPKEAMELFYPYVLIDDGLPVFGEMFAQPMEPSVFGKGPR